MPTWLAQWRSETLSDLSQRLTEVLPANLTTVTPSECNNNNEFILCLFQFCCWNIRMKSFSAHFMCTCPMRLCEHCVLQIHLLFWFLWQRRRCLWSLYRHFVFAFWWLYYEFMFNSRCSDEVATFKKRILFAKSNHIHLNCVWTTSFLWSRIY